MEQLAAALERHRIERPLEVALVEESRVVRYGELVDLVMTQRRRLNEYGAGVVAIELDNGIDWLTWDLAAAFSGVVCVPIPSCFVASQRAHVYGAAGVDTVIRSDGIESIYTPAVQLPSGTGKITFTSGTTGTPKGVCLPFDGLERVAGSVLDAVGVSGNARHFSAMPLAVLLENVAGTYAALMAGCRIDVPARAGVWMDSAALLQGLADSRASTVILVPELLRGLLTAMETTGQSLPDLEFVAVGGSRVAVELVQRAWTFGLPVHEGYGLSECGSVVALNKRGEDRPGTVGTVLPHVDLHIENGEIVVSNPVFLGYLDGERRGKLRTGDLGSRDKDGYLSVNGRRKNVLITSYGRNISPEWVEAGLLCRPEIRQVFVYGDGLPSPLALIVPQTGIDDSDLEQAVAVANTALPGYARVAGWSRVPPFSREDGLLTDTGRLRRQRIIERYLKDPESAMNQLEFYDRLVESTDDVRRELYAVPQLVDGLNGRISRDTYVAYLTEAYHHVRHTVPFLMAMGARLPSDKPWLQEAVIEYIKEEAGHEQWILDDIKAAGGDPERARRTTPNLETQALVAYNYDYIQRRNPMGFLGMVFMLESTSMQIATRGAASIQSALDLPDEAFSYLYSHGELDQTHMEFFRNLVSRIEGAGDQQAIVEVARNTFRMFANVLRSIPHDQGVRNVA